MQRQFTHDNNKISYSVNGEGKTVLLLHGFAEDSTIWDEQIAFLEKYCQVITIDLPGSGSSELLQKENVSIEDYAEVVAALLSHEAIDKCIMIGHSMGGYVTLAFAEAFATKLSAFGFVHSTAFADSEEKKGIREKAISFIEEYGVSTFLKNTTPNLFGANFKKNHAEKITDLVEKGNAFTKEALTQYYKAMMNRPDKTELLKKTAVPVLFVVGSEDVAAPLDDLLKQVHLPRIADIHILKEVGHMSMLESPEELNKALLHFVTLI